MVHDLSPTARALLAFEAIQNRPGLTGDELAARLGVTDRAARRYVGILREAGMPVESVSGRYGGYSVGRGARVPPLMFSTAEALGLVMALLRGWHGSINTNDPAATALGKILRVLPDAAAAPAEALRRVVAQNPSDAAATPAQHWSNDAVRVDQARHPHAGAHRTLRPLLGGGTRTVRRWVASNERDGRRLIASVAMHRPRANTDTSDPGLAQLFRSADALLTRSIGSIRVTASILRWPARPRDSNRGSYRRCPTATTTCFSHGIFASAGWAIRGSNRCACLANSPEPSRQRSPISAFRSFGRSLDHRRLMRAAVPYAGAGSQAPQPAAPRTKRARSARSMANTFMYFTPMATQAFGTLMFLGEFDTTSIVTTVWQCA